MEMKEKKLVEQELGKLMERTLNLENELSTLVSYQVKYN